MEETVPPSATVRRGGKCLKGKEGGGEDLNVGTVTSKGRAGCCDGDGRSTDMFSHAVDGQQMM